METRKVGVIEERKGESDGNRSLWELGGEGMGTNLPMPQTAQELHSRKSSIAGWSRDDEFTLKSGGVSDRGGGNIALLGGGDEK